MKSIAVIGTGPKGVAIAAKAKVSEYHFGPDSLAIEGRIFCHVLKPGKQVALLLPFRWQSHRQDTVSEKELSPEGKEGKPSRF